MTIHYHGRNDPIAYPWGDRAKIKWGNVRRCRLDFTEPKRHYTNDGEAVKRPGVRIKKD